MLNITKDKCCGCTACVERCPVKCIRMVTDSQGFQYPEIDQEVCIRCGACDRVCPYVNDNGLTKATKAYAVWMRDEATQIASSSGGMGYELGRHVIEQGGVVYGCEASGLDVRHVRITTLEGLRRLQGSKYVQSDLTGVFKDIKADLREGRKVLFTGTPCQSAGLKRFIGSGDKDLIRVDLICHGVPSQQMLREHVAGLSGGLRPDKISFRKGQEYVLTLESGGRIYYKVNFWQEMLRDLYYLGFIDGVTYRPNCYSCPFASVNRVSDITMGDFHGLHLDASVKPNRQTGLSVVLPTTPKGEALFAAVTPRLNVIERSIEEACAGNPQLNGPMKRTRKSRLFHRLYPLLPFVLALRIVYTRRLLRNRAGGMLRKAGLLK